MSVRPPVLPHAWKPTFAHLRAATAGAAALTVAVVWRRPDLAVIGVPLVVVAVWSALRRPRGAVRAVQRVDRPVLREGEATTWHATVSGDDADAGRLEDVAAQLVAPPRTELRPPAGGLAATWEADGRPGPLHAQLRALRWGRGTIDPTTVAVSSAWGAFRATTEATPPMVLSTLPVPDRFDATAPGVHAVGLVGMERSPVKGSGTEFAELRPFQPGDRLRRINWPRSSRAGTLLVSSTWADQDRLVVLVIDAARVVGRSEGVDGTSSSLDVAVRATVAIADHHLRRGDRVALHVIGARGMRPVPPMSGLPQLRRIVERILLIEPGTDRFDRQWQLSGLPSGSMLVVLSPLSSHLALERTVAAARRGLAVVVVDTLPPEVLDEELDRARALAWRIRLLEREREVRRARELGVPIVPWRGPGSLDDVLRYLQRRARSPRLVRR